MKAKVKIISELQRSHAIALIRELNFDVVHTVEIKEYKRNRSAEANALYWQWLTIIGNELGEPKEALHEKYKNDFLVNIYTRDDPEYGAMVQAIRDVWRYGLKAEAVGLRKKIVALTSTTGATTSQMSEYMTAIENHAATLSIRLPHPEEND